MNIYIVRHCKAEGQSPDAKLTEEGFLQANMLAEFLDDKKIDQIICSPFLRAQQSIHPLAEKLKLEVISDQRLAERVLCAEDHPNWREMLRTTFDDLELCYEGGESSSLAMSRAISVIKAVEASPFSNVVLVTHGNLMSLLLKQYDNHRFGFEEWEALSNPDVYLLAFDERVPSIQRLWRDKL